MRRFLVLFAAAALSMALVADPSTSAPPGHDGSAGHRDVQHAKALKPWVTVAPVNLGIEQPDLLRVGNRLHVVWSEFQGSERAVRSRQLSNDAKTIGPRRTVVDGWLAVIDDPKLARVDGDLIAVFAGIRSSAPGDPYVGPAVHASSPDGVDWTLEPGSLSQTTAAGNAQSIDLVNADGQPLWGMGGFGDQMTLHRGVSASSPASQPDFNTGSTGCCPTTSVALANDTATDQTWAAWFALSATDPDEIGVFTQKVWPRPNGTMLRAPGSNRGQGALNPGVPVALASRAGGGLYLAYAVGFPSTQTIRLWKVGTGRFVDLRLPHSFSSLSLTAGPKGRMWMAWASHSSKRIVQAVRTNRQVTKVGAIRTIPVPGGPSLGQLNTLALEGARGPLVAVAGSQPPGSGSNGLYATQILPGLSVKVAPRQLRRGKVTATVTDAGAAVKGARVTFRGKAEATNARGKAVFTVRSSVADGRYLVAASKKGYFKGSARVRVT